jgi:transcriptional regulator with XRE-family HTH domain
VDEFTFRFSDRIRHAADLRGLTYEQIARSVGVSQPAVAQWATGVKKPSRPNLVALARVLEVELAWLEDGQGPAPGRRHEELRAEYTDINSGIAWRFRPAPPDGRDFGNANIWSFAPGIPAFVREWLQNALDARASATVDVVFRLIILRGLERSAFLKAMQWEHGLAPHVRAAAKGWHKLGRFLDDGLRAFDGGDELILMSIEERGTTGLTGEELGPGGNFAALARNNLDSQKSPTAGGAFGLGKAVLWRSSQILTVLMNSNLNAPDSHGRSQNRVFGKVELGFHETEQGATSEAWWGPGWFGRTEKVGSQELAVSNWANPVLAADLHLDRPAEPGTSMVIVGFHDPSGEHETPDAITDAIAKTAGEWFWPSMSDGRLTVAVEVWNGAARVRSTVVDPANAVAALYSLLTDHRAGKIDDQLEAGVGATVAKAIPLRIPRRVAASPDAPVHGDLVHDAVLLVRRADPDQSEMANQIAFYRGPGMVIMYEDLKALAAGAPPFHAVVLCGEAAGDSPEAKAAERFLRTAEPPSHREWTSTQELKTDYARGGTQAIRDFRRDVRAAIAELVAPPEDDLAEGPRLLRELLRLVGDNPAPPPRPRVVRPEGKVDGEAWRVSAGIFVKAGANGWLGRPVVVFNAETGAGREVGWSELVAVKDCVIRDGNLLYIPAGKREATFRGVTDSKTHHVPVRESSIAIDFRDVRPDGDAS